MLVPLDSWPSVEPDAIYGVRVTEELVRKDLPSRDSVTYYTTEGFDRDSLDKDLHDFVTNIVPWDTSALLLKRGIVAPLPDQSHRFTVGIGFQYLESVLWNIRDASVQGLFHSLLDEQSADAMNPVRKRFEAVAEMFESEMHNLGLSMLVRSAHADEDIERAKAYVLAALDRISSDTALEESDRSQRLEEVLELLRDLENPSS